MVRYGIWGDLADVDVEEPPGPLYIVVNEIPL